MYLCYRRNKTITDQNGAISNVFNAPETRVELKTYRYAELLKMFNMLNSLFVCLFKLKFNVPVNSYRCPYFMGLGCHDIQN